MFKKKIDLGTTDTLIGEGSTFEGKIKSQASIRLEGEITGDVVCEGDVIIGERGVARSNVSARNVVLAGTVHGNIAAKEKLTVKSSGRLFGNLSAAELAIEAGGLFQGTSRMENKDAAGEDSRASATAGREIERRPAEDAAAGVAAADAATVPKADDASASVLKTW